MADLPEPTILFVDDDEGSREALTWVFRDAGFAVLEAGTGLEALELSRERHPELVVLDVSLPDVNGFEVCRRIKARASPPAPAVVHLSAVFVGSGDRTQGLEGGADAYLIKPVEPRELLATVRALLRVRAAEEVARRAAQEWRTTFDAISDAVCLLDPAGRISRCNRAMCRLVGRTFAEVLGRPLEGVIQQGFALDHPPRLIPAGCPAGHESQEVLLAGHWFRLTLDPLPAGAAAGCVLILTDVTERKQLEEQLLQGQRLEAVGRLAGGIAHDFNNLLTAILGNASLLLRSLPPAEREHELVATMERAAWRAADLTRQLLGFSRQTLLWLRILDPGTVLDEAVAALRPSLPASVRLVVRRPEPLWTIQADPVQLALVLSHLCRNAIEAMPEGGLLLLEAQNEMLSAEDVHHPEARPGAFVRLRVQDTGPGIPAELLDKIFDPFFTTKPVGQGTGLGLAMVYGIVKQHQGWVHCHSGAGEGTRFDLYLPRAVADVPDYTPAPTTVASPAGPRVVLLADDNDTLRALAAAYLTQGGFQVLLASDGREAVELFQREQERVDLVILDQMMPHLTGRDALEQMRRIKPAVRALFATASSNELDREPGQERGLIAKPYRERDLLQAVHQALDPPA